MVPSRNPDKTKKRRWKKSTTRVRKDIDVKSRDRSTEGLALEIETTEGPRESVRKTILKNCRLQTRDYLPI